MLFSYIAKNQHGDKVKGKVESQSNTQASSILRERGLLIIKLQEIDQEGSFFATSFSKVKQDDIVNMTRQLSTMITAGLSLIDALSLLQDQSKPAMRKIISQLLKDIEGGSTFAQALEEHEEFSRIYIHLVRAGEAAGVLDEVLKRLAENLEKQKEFRGKVRGALIYPAIVVTAMVVVVAVMMIFVIPKLSEMYKDFGADLPFMTQLLIGISTFFSKFWYVIAVVIAGGIFLLRSWKKTETGEKKIDEAILKLPIFGVLKQKIILTEFSRTLSLLLGAGISLLQALDIVRDSIENSIYREALQEATDQVEKGASLSDALSRFKVFPSLIQQMISVGEETGRLDEVLLKVSRYYETESEQAVKALTTAIEPILMIVLGVGVGLLMVAIIMPIYQLTSQL